MLWHADLNYEGRLLLPGGFLGVDIFFVISGFLMARIWQGGISISDFAKRRLRRILPMLFIVILICVPFALWLMERSARIDFGANAAASTLLVPNIFYGLQDSYWAAPGKLRPLLHLWTIGVEIQFYLLCPLIFLALKRSAKPIFGLSLISLLSFAAAFILSRSHPEFAFYNLPTRLWEFSLGALVFYAPKSKLNPMIYATLGGVLILGSFLIITERIVHPAGLTLLPVIGTCLILYAGHEKTGGILTVPILRRIGLISFSAYLIHQPFFVFTRIATENTDLPALIAIGLIVLTLILSEITYRLIETPLRKAGTLKGFAITALGVAALASGLMLQNAEKLPGPNSESLSLIPERWILNAAETRCVSKPFDHPCRLGNSSQAPTIALLGDSHIQAMSGGFDEFFNEQNINDIDYSMGGCPFIMGVRRFTRKYPCDEFIEDVFADLKRRDIKTAIILDRRNAYLMGNGAVFNDGRAEIIDVSLYAVSLGPDAEASLQKAEVERLHLKTITRLREMGLRVILIYPVPEIGIHVPDEIMTRLQSGDLPLTLTRGLHDGRQKALESLKALAWKDPNIVTFDPADTFCSDAICKTHSDREIYYTDRDHLSRAGTELFLSVERDKMLRAIKTP